MSALPQAVAIAHQPPVVSPVVPPVQPPDPTAAAAAWALQASDVAYAYRHGTAPVIAGVSLAVAPREIVALLGGSGCGKSTLLRLLAGLAQPTAGHIALAGQPLAAPHPRTALVFQKPSLLPWLDVEGNVGFGLDFKHQPALTRAQRRERVATVLEAVGLPGKGGLYPAQLSGGMAQRVALARALAREPRLLLADEPFSAVDAITRAELQELLVALVHRWQTAAVLVTHDIDEAVLVADRVVLLGAAPGQPAGVVREWAVPIARPRHAHPAATTALRLDILAALQAIK